MNIKLARMKRRKKAEMDENDSRVNMGPIPNESNTFLYISICSCTLGSLSSLLGDFYKEIREVVEMFRIRLKGKQDKYIQPKLT